jgi:hypothetical protein
VCRPLSGQDLSTMTLGDLERTPASEKLRRRRAELGLPSDDAAPLLIDPVTGAAITPDRVPLHLRRAQLTRTSLDANTGICRGMLRHRYATEGQGEEAQD